MCCIDFCQEHQYFTDCRNTFCGIVVFVRWLIMGLLIEVENDCHDTGLPQVAVRRNCQLF